MKREAIRSLGDIRPMRSAIVRAVDCGVAADKHHVGVVGLERDRLVVPTLRSAVVRSVGEFHPVCTAINGLETPQQVIGGSVLTAGIWGDRAVRGGGPGSL